MNRVLALVAGVAAWAAVAVVAVLIVFNMGGKNQVLMFLPILAAVAAAWVIGELVTGHVFTEHEKEA